MREERGQIIGNVVVYEEFTVWGTIVGNVSVVRGGKLYARGIIYGNLSVESGGRVHVYGNVSGHVTVNKKAKLIHSGVIGGDATNNGGRLFIDMNAKVIGKVKTTGEGETTDERKFL